MDMRSLFIVIAIGYIFGCIQSSYILGKLIQKIDIRKFGTNNAGTSNALLILGWKYGIIVCIIDIFKATLALIIVKYFFKNYNDINFLVYLCGASVIVGHNFPFYMNFKGGKGTASLLGMLIGIDWRMALLGLMTLIIITLVSNYIAIGTIALLLSFCIITALHKFGVGTIIISAAITFISICKHWVNLKRIRNHEETRVRQAIIDRFNKL